MNLPNVVCYHQRGNTHVSARTGNKTQDSKTIMS